MNTETMFSSKTDLWATPQDFYDKLNSEFNFTLAPPRIMLSVLNSTPKSRTGSDKIGAGILFFAIRHTVGIYTHGFVNAAWRHKKLTQ